MFDYSQLDLLYGSTYKVTRKMSEYNEHGQKPDYKIHNHCNGCRINYPKSIMRCSKCGDPLRYNPTSKKHTKLFEGY